jgi:hypothetical protein
LQRPQWVESRPRNRFPTPTQIGLMLSDARGPSNLCHPGLCRDRAFFLAASAAQGSLAPAQGRGDYRGKISSGIADLKGDTQIGAPLPRGTPGLRWGPKVTDRREKTAGCVSRKVTFRAAGQDTHRRLIDEVATETDRCRLRAMPRRYSDRIAGVSRGVAPLQRDRTA